MVNDIEMTVTHNYMPTLVPGYPLVSTMVAGFNFQYTFTETDLESDPTFGKIELLDADKVLIDP